MKKSIQDVLKKYDVMHLEKDIIDTLEPTIQMHLCEEMDDNIKIGISKFGGSPDLPDEFGIPTKDDKPLRFLAQINLEEVQSYYKGNLLPAKGMLYVFYDVEEQPWGYEPKDVGTHRILYTENTVNLKKRIMFAETFPSSVISFQETWTLAQEKNWETGLSEEDEWDFYVELESIYEGKGYEGFHHLLGSAQAIQSEEMAEQCHFVTNGLYLGNSYHWEKEMEKLPGSPDDWMLLMQIDSNDESEMGWGDAGRLYIWIQKEELKQKNFENTWLILQCH